MRRCAVVMVMLAMVSLALASQSNPVTEQSMLPLTVAEREVTDNGMTLSLDIQEPIWMTVDSESGVPLELAALELGGAYHVEGMPMVPVAGSMFRIPPTSGVVVEVVNAEYETYTDVEYAAFVQGELDEAEFSYAEVSSQADEWFPGELASVGEPAIFRDFRVTNLLTYPVQVNPARNEVRVYSNIQVQIRFEGVDNRNVLAQWPTHISRHYVDKYRVFLDWDDAELDDYEFYSGNVLVVMRDDDALRTAMSDWFEFKEQKGWKFDYITDSDISWTASAIGDELEERYAEAVEKPEYIVLIGDDQGSFSIPPGSGSGYGAGDQPYSCIVGDDNLADIGIGRISVQSFTQAQAYAAKVLSYELDVDFDNTDWYLRGMLNRSDGYAGISKVIMLRYYRYCMVQLGYTQIDTVMWGGGNSFAVQRINDGVSFYGARGYINSGLNTGTIGGLDNYHMTPVVIDVTCGTGNWSGGTAISEAYMRAGTTNNPTGGIVAFGMATSGTGPDLNNCLTGASGWSMLQVEWPTTGDMILAGKVNGWVNYHGHNDSRMNSFLQWYNMMGDPLVYIWTDIPHQFDVDASQVYTLGQHEYSVTVEEDGEPVADAWVTFYKKNGGDDIQISRYTDSNGEVTFYPEVTGTGNAMVTVTKKNFAPTQVQVSCNTTNASVGYQGITIVDNGVGGTVGDGDGVAEAGETVGLQMMLKNYGDETATDISITGSSDDPYVTDVYGAVTLGSMDPNETVQGPGMVLVEISPAAQHNWLIPIDLTIETDGGTVDDAYEFDVTSVKYVIASVNVTGMLEPGDTRNATVTIANIGGVDADAATAMFISRDPWLRATQYSCTIPALDVGDQTNTSSVELFALEGGFTGYSASAMLVITTASGHVDTAYTTVTLGERAATDPVGPDRYGYMAFENVDTGYPDYAPDYDWVEINPDVNNNDFDGTEINIYDGSENDDDGITLDLTDIGFPITYYGEEFEEISVVTNGTLAMGIQGDIAANRNWTIPSPGGPSYMIAPYWDELQTNGDCEILYYYDEPNGRLIFEFYKMRHHNTSYESTFEVIFYDTDMYPTATGDNDFVFQYGECDHSTGGMGYDVPYWTTGIENGDQTDGLLFAYWNQYAPGASEITNGRAIYFTTNIAVPVGSISGVVIDAETDSPIEGAVVRTNDWMFSAVTNGFGSYEIDSVFVGTYDLVVDKECYNEAVVADVVIEEGGAAEVDVQMVHPEFELSALELNTTLAPDSETVLTVDLVNNGNGPLHYNADLHFPNEAMMLGKKGAQGNRGPVAGNGELDEPWDVLFEFGLDPSENRYNGIVFDGEYFWLSGSNNYDVSGPNKLYQYNDQGEFIDVFDQPVPAGERSSQGFYGMVWDGEYLYGGDHGVLYQMEFDGTEWTVVETMDIPANPSRYLVLDPNTYIFYVGDYGTVVRGVHADSQDVVYEFGQEFYPRGAGWFPEDELGYNIYFICQAGGSNMIEILKMDPTTGATRPVHSYQEVESAQIQGGDLTYLWDPSVWQFMSIVKTDDGHTARLWEVDTYSNWVQILNPSGTVEAGETNTIDIRVHSYGLPEDTFRVAVEYSHNACTENQEWVDVEMVVFEENASDEQAGSELPTDYVFEGAYPNPFNPMASVRFGLPETAHVKAVVFNVLGQKVATLMDQPMQAGYHTMRFDGSDLASGMYFLTFQAGPMQETTRLILMK